MIMACHIFCGVDRTKLVKDSRSDLDGALSIKEKLPSPDGERSSSIS
jgi:hypothetical protein